MPRLHLFEFEDKKWLPSFLRNYMTDFLQSVTRIFKFYKNINPILIKGIQKSGSSRIIDLASGGGGPWISILDGLSQEIKSIKVLLTDFYPNHESAETLKKLSSQRIDYYPESVNALDVPKVLVGLRTMFLSFHHFNPKDAKQILQNAVDAKMPIAIFEAQERSIAHLIQFFFSPINVILLTPFIRPFKLGRIIFTYLIPIVPILVWWDGLVSVLRTYTVDEMKTMTSELKLSSSFDWEVGKNKNGPISILYILGTPK